MTINGWKKFQNLAPPFSNMKGGAGDEHKWRQEAVYK
jgi:hypothetical protein